MVAHRYRTKDGKVVPSVSTILRNWGDPGGLMFWAHKQGLEGKDLDEIFRCAQDDGHFVKLSIRLQLGTDFVAIFFAQ